jgi:hypothetical protein
MRVVIIESPYAGDIERNITYARQCMLDCLMRGEAPFASHLLYTQCLNDNVPAERALGMAAGEAVMERADASVVYVNFGISEGMQAGIAAAVRFGLPIEYRRL